MSTKDDYEWKNVDSRGESLLKAHKIINGERQSKHGKPEDSFQTIAEYWNTYIKAYAGVDVQLGKAQVCELMSLLKKARMTGQGYNPDNYRDAEGYLALADDFRKQAEESRIDAELSGFGDLHMEKDFPEAENFVCGCSECDGDSCDQDCITNIRGMNEKPN